MIWILIDEPCIVPGSRTVVSRLIVAVCTPEKGFSPNRCIFGSISVDLFKLCLRLLVRLIAVLDPGSLETCLMLESGIDILQLLGNVKSLHRTSILGIGEIGLTQQRDHLARLFECICPTDQRKYTFYVLSRLTCFNCHQSPLVVSLFNKQPLFITFAKGTERLQCPPVPASLYIVCRHIVESLASHLVIPFGSLCKGVCSPVVDTLLVEDPAQTVVGNACSVLPLCPVQIVAIELGGLIQVIQHVVALCNQIDRP